MKRLSGTSKNIVILCVGVLAVIAAFLAGMGASGLRVGLIGREEAKSVALADAGLDGSEVSALRAGLEFDDGRFVYEVDFYSGGAEYEYVIRAKDGDILARDIEGGSRVPAQDIRQAQPSTGQPPTAQPSTDQPPAAQPSTGQPPTAQPPASQAPADQPSICQLPTSQPSTDQSSAGGDIGADRAKEIALEHAGLTQEGVSFLRAEREYDDGRLEYEVEFYCGRTEYSYAIDAVSGEILEYDVDSD